MGENEPPAGQIPLRVYRTRWRAFDRDIPYQASVPALLESVLLGITQPTVVGCALQNHWTQEQIHEKSNILDPSHSIPRRTDFIKQAERAGI